MKDITIKSIGDSNEIENKVDYSGRKFVNDYDSYNKKIDFFLNNFTEKIIEKPFSNNSKEDFSIQPLLSNEKTSKMHFVESKVNINEFYIKNLGNTCSIHHQKYCIFYDLKLKVSLCSLCKNDSESSEIVEKIDYMKPPEKIVEDIFYDFDKKNEILSEKLKKIMNFTYKFKTKCNSFDFLFDADIKICKKLFEYKYFESFIENIEINVNETKKLMVNDLKKIINKKIFEDDSIFLSFYYEIQKMNNKKHFFSLEIQNVFKEIERFNDEKEKIYLEIKEFSEEISPKLQNLINNFLIKFEEINKKSSVVLKSNNCYELLPNKSNTCFYIFQDNELKKVYKKCDFYKFNIRLNNFFFEKFNNAYLRKIMTEKDKLDRIFVSFSKFKIFYSNYDKIISNKKINFGEFDEDHNKVFFKHSRKKLIEIIDDYQSKNYYLIFKISTCDGFCSEKYLLPVKLFDIGDKEIELIAGNIINNYPGIKYIPFKTRLNEFIEQY